MPGAEPVEAPGVRVPGCLFPCGPPWSPVVSRAWLPQEILKKSLRAGFRVPGAGRRAS